MAKYTWSYSSATTFEKCPKQYYHLYVAKDVKNDISKSEHIIYGNQVHKAAEHYVRDGVPLPNKFKEFEKTLDRLKAIPGEKLCEVKLGLTRDLKPTGFFADDVWWRGAVDLLIVDEDSGLATVIDYKTGKSSAYADTRQLSLLSIAVFKHYPNIQRIKAGLIFLVCKDLVKEQFHIDMVDDLYEEWGSIIHRIETAYDSGVFNAVPNFTCKSCPVVSCAHKNK